MKRDVKSRRRRDYLVNYDSKWGRWTPERRYNVDQVPCPFIIDQEITYEQQGSSIVWISQPGNGLDKRQCTLQLTICADDPQRVPPAVIFRGKGNIPKSEIDLYSQRVHVYWQEKGWMDSNVALQWTEKTFAPAVDCSAENILFLDNLACQMTQEFHMKCKELASTLVYPLPPDETDRCQPVDQGEGNMIKKLMGEELDHHLEEGENLERWHSHLKGTSGGKKS